MESATTAPSQSVSRKVAANEARRTWPFIGSFAPSSVSPYARRNYRHELLAVATWPVAVAMIEGSVTAIIANKAFPDTPPWVVATLTAAPTVSNVTSSLWTRLVDGARTIRSLKILELGVLAMIALIALVPINGAGLAMFTAAAVTARMLMAGVITLRAVLWRSNYQRHERARVTGKLITIQTIIVAMAGYALGEAMDHDERAFRLVYPISVLFGLIGVMAFARLRIRHPFLILAPSRRADAAGLTQRFGMLAAWGETLVGMVRVLRDDFAFRGYMVCMFVMGISNMAITAPLVQMADEKFDLDYAGSILLVNSLPLALMPFTIPLWARFLDRTHVIRYRAIHSWTFVLAHVLTFVAGSLGSVAVFAAAQVVRSIGFSGGTLAWNIGHNDFGQRHEAGLYMTVHVTLTGFRGLIGSYAGAMLYSGVTLNGRRFAGLAEHSFLFWALVGALGALGFYYLNWKLRDVTGQRPGAD